MSEQVQISFARLGLMKLLPLHTADRRARQRRELKLSRWAQVPRQIQEGSSEPKSRVSSSLGGIEVGAGTQGLSLNDTK